jgi:hypothetical protein
MSISKIKEKSLTTGAVTDANFDKTVLTDQTELSATAASDDILLIYDTSAGVIKKIQKSNIALQVPVFSSVSPTSLTTGDLTGNYTIVVTGTGFDENATFKLRTTGGTDISMDSVSRDSSTQLTGTVAKNTANLTNANEPFDIIITNESGLSTTATDQINVDAQPVYTTASGSLGSGTGGDSLSFSVNATDPESAGNITFELQSGSLPPGFSLTNTAAEGGTAVISGTATNPAANTTYNFVLRAVDAASNTSSRAFSITINRLFSIQSFTSSGTFAVPSGTTSLSQVLVVAGGGGGGGRLAGAGGAGGLIFMPEYPVTPSGTITVTVGCGGPGGDFGPGTPGNGTNGQDSVFGSPGDPGLGTGGVLTAKGGGFGRGGSGNPGPGNPGGSGGGGRSCTACVGGTATQPTQPGNSGAYGFGNPGGAADNDPPIYNGGGGGGAGAAGEDADSQGTAPASKGGNGGDGRAYTIADGTTPVYYAGGGGGSAERPGVSIYVAPGGQGGGGNSGYNNTGCVAAQPGTANRGGGGGAGTGCASPVNGGAGGKGIVIVRY